MFTLGGDATSAVLSSPSGDDISWMSLVVSSAGVVTLTGTPSANITATTDYDFTVTTSGSGCQQASISGTITTTPTPRVVPSASSVGAISQVVCEGTTIDPITYDLLDIESAPLINTINLPPGVNYSISSNTIQISGTPLNVSTFTSFNFTIEAETTNGCVGLGSGSIQVYPQDEFVLTTPGADFNTYCVDDTIAPITYQFAGGTTGASIEWKEDGNLITGNPQGISVSVNANDITISGTFNGNISTAKAFSYIITSSNAGSCATSSISGSLTFEEKPDLIIHSSSNQLDQQICEGIAIDDIVFEASSDVDAVQISWDNVPNGITGQFNVATKLFTISGTPQNIDADVFYTYTVTARNQSTGCVSEEQTGVIQVYPNHDLNLVSGSSTASQELCEGNALSADVIYEFGGGATSAEVIGLDGTGFDWIVSGNKLTISGTASLDVSTVTNINYTVNTIGNSCGNVSIGGTITLKPDSKLEHIVASGATNQIICEGEPIDNIQYEVTEAFWDYAVSGLPNGVSHSIDLTTKIITITGTPSENITSDQTYNYVIKAFNETSCDSPELNGIINVTAGPELTNKGSSATLDQSVCLDTSIDKISIQFTNSTVPTVTGLPAGLATQVVGDVLEITGSIASGGTYNFDVTTNNSTCTNTIAIPIQIEVQPNFSILSQTDADYNEDLTINTGESRVKSIACYGDRSGEIKVEMSDNSISYLYSWKGPNNYSNTTTSNTIKNLLPGTYTVSVSAIQTSDCSVSETFVVREPSPLQIQTNEIVPVSCDGTDDGIISIEATGGNSDFYKQLTWYYLEEETSCFTFNLALRDADNDGIYDIIDADIDNDGNTDTGKTDANFDGIEDSADADLNGVVDPNYVLSSVNYQNCDSGQFTSLNLVTGDFSASGSLVICARPNSVSVEANLDHDLDPNTNMIGSVTVDGGTTSCSSGSWIVDPDLTGSSYASNLKDGLYKVVVEEIEFLTGDVYCSIEETFEVAKNEISYANVSVSDTYCLENSGTIDLDVRATSEVLYFYYNGVKVADSNVSVIEENFNEKRYRLTIINPVDMATLEIQDEFGCGIAVNTDLLDISVNAPDFTYTSPELERYGTISVRTSVSFKLNGINSYDAVVWDFGDSSATQVGSQVTHVYQAEGTYTVTLTAYNASGCFKTTTQEIVIGKGYSLVMPNTFTPNNDNINDRIGPSFTGLKEVNFFVYNKSGVQIYQESVTENSVATNTAIKIVGWDGSNSDPNSNYYVYKIIATRLNDEIITDTGTIFLLK